MEPTTIIFDVQSAFWSSHSDVNVTFIKCQMNYAEDKRQVNGHIFLNEIHDMFGVPRTKEGQLLGWVDTPIEYTTRFGSNDVIYIDLVVEGLIYDRI